MATSPDGKTILVGSQAGVEERSLPNLKSQRTIKTKLENVHALAFSPRGDLLAVAGGSPSESGIVELYQWPKASLLRRIEAHKDLIYAVSWKPDGSAIATASADGTCGVFGFNTGKRLVHFKGHSRPVLDLCYLPDGKSIVSTGIDQSLRVWDATTARSIRALDNHVKQVHALALRPSSDPDALAMLASVSEDKTVRLWQPTIGRMVRFARLKSPAQDVAWTHDGKRLLVCCRDGYLRVIDPDSLAIRSEKKLVDGWAHVLTGLPKRADVIVGGEGGQLHRTTPP